jgi:hypothetical protein
LTLTLTEDKTFIETDGNLLLTGAAIKHALDAKKFTDDLRDKMTEEQMNESGDLLVKFWKQYSNMLVK